jgi:hypothetical protein
MNQLFKNKYSWILILSGVLSTLVVNVGAQSFSYTTKNLHSHNDYLVFQKIIIVLIN